MEGRVGAALLRADRLQHANNAKESVKNNDVQLFDLGTNHMRCTTWSSRRRKTAKRFCA